MKGSVTYLTIIILVSTIQICRAQSNTEVSSPELALVNNRIEIRYDIINSKSSEEFRIRLEITDSKGNLIPARTFSGDIGGNISGGAGKIIIWDFEADSIFLDEDIFAQIFALQEVQAEGEEIIPQDKKSFSRTSLIIQSLAFPGLGLTRINPGKPHWIKGVAAYSCLGGAIYLNQQAIKNYDAYLNSDNSEQRDDYYDISNQQDLASEILGITAIGIWVADLIWTVVGTKSLSKSEYSFKQKGFHISTGFDSLSSAPLLSFQYKF